MQILNAILDKIDSLLNDESGQDVFEYVLIIGGISVLVLTAAVFTVPELFDGVITSVCNAINGIDGITVTC